jgi:hypothetical protein
VVTPCPLCEKGGPLYDHTEVCCHVRFLLKEPRIGVRRAWLARLDAKLPKLAVQVRAAFAEAWKTRKVAA